MQEQNNELNSLLQNVASSILTNDNVVINVDNETDNTSVVVVEGNDGDVVDSIKEEGEDNDEEDDNDGDMNDVGVVTLTALL